MAGPIVARASSGGSRVRHLGDVGGDHLGRHALDGGAHGEELGHHVLAAASFVEHRGDPAQLPVGPRQAIPQRLLVIGHVSLR